MSVADFEGMKDDFFGDVGGSEGCHERNFMKSVRSGVFLRLVDLWGGSVMFFENRNQI